MRDFLPERLRLHLPTRRDVDVHYLLSGRAHDGVASSEITEVAALGADLLLPDCNLVVLSQLLGAGLRLRTRYRRHDDD